MAGQAASYPQNASYTPGLEKRRFRREAVCKIIAQLEDIRYNEELFLDRIPENLQESPACENAEHSVGYLMDAIETLQYAY
jgi:hypothetical protein